jgi:hypothetical protein
MCDVAEDIIAALSPLGLQFRYEKEGKEGITTTNGQAEFETVRGEIKKVLSKKRGELIEMEGKGSITDLGQPTAEISDGYYAEFYCYDCLSASFIRIWSERALFMEKKWISVDIDEINDSLWFHS